MLQSVAVATDFFKDQLGSKNFFGRHGDRYIVGDAPFRSSHFGSA